MWAIDVCGAYSTNDSAACNIRTALIDENQLEKG
jgi:hypothetical protein